MKRSSVNIAITNPCNQDFSGFDKTKVGGFCQSCKKEVIDFTKMSENEVIDYLKTAQQNTCGMFKEEQLKTYSVPVTSEYAIAKPFNIGVMAFSLLSFLSIGKVQAQKQPKATSEIVTKQQTAPKSIKNDQNDFLKGRITDEYGDVVIGASVVIKGTSKITITDFDGNYSFPKEYIKENAVIVASCLGYKTLEFNASNLKEKMIIDKNFKEVICVVGQLETKKVHKDKPNFFQRLFLKKKNKTFSKR